MNLGRVGQGTALWLGFVLALVASPLVVEAEETRVAALTPELLSAYVANARTATLTRELVFSPETWAVPEPANEPQLSAAMLDAYVANGYVKTEKRVANMQDERACLAAAIYHEARGESESGQWAVADVILNRVASPRYPDSICGVVYQNADRGKYKCQFSFACDGKPDAGGVGNRMVRESWVRAYVIAEAALKQSEIGVRTDTVPTSALFYHTVAVQPSWADKLKRVASIGSHVFYAVQ